jgi:hypothetical protein
LKEDWKNQHQLGFISRNFGIMNPCTPLFLPWGHFVPNWTIRLDPEPNPLELELFVTFRFWVR